jgi:hypothetical protein
MALIELDAQTSDEAEPAERATEPLFRVGGKVYNIIKEFTASECLRALEIAATQGNIVSKLWLMQTALGQEGFNALKGANEMRPEQFKEISDIIEAKSLSTSKGMLGK